jgi:DNA polymerase-1
MKVSLMNPVVRDAVRPPEGCTDCSLSADGMSNCITAEGNENADLLVLTRLPLGPRNRAELHDYLSNAGIDPSEVAITSVTKCSGHDSQTKESIKACRRHLEAEIDTIKPKWILALGSEALLTTTGRSGIMKYRGQVFPFKGKPDVQVIATISPSMVFRNPGLRGGFIADLAFINRMSKGEKLSDALVPKRVASVVSKRGLQALADELKVCEGYAFDIETTSFDEFKPDSRIISLALSTWRKGDTGPRDCWVIPLYHPESPWRTRWKEVLERIAVFLRMPKKRVAHNGKFDLRWLRHFGARFSLTFDTMLAAHLLNENRPKSLDSLARELCGVEAWKIDNKTLIDEPLKKVVRYNGMDTWNTALIYFVLRKQLAEQRRLAVLFTRMSVPASEVFTDIERRGIFVDVPLMDERAHIVKQELKAIDDGLMEWVPDREHWPANVKDVNFNASNFARWWIFDWLEMPVGARGKSGDPSMAEGIMSKLAQDHPHKVLNLLLDRVKWNKYDTSFFSAYQEQVDDNSRIHTTFKLTGTVTGRLSSGKGDTEKVTGRIQNRGVNLQQVPRDAFVRGIFGAAPGWAFIECDYSQIELRVAAFVANEPTMKHLYNTGQDIHMAMAMRMTGKPADQVTKEERKKAKAVNFGFLYGMGWKKFISTAWENYGVVVTEEEAKSFRKAFFDEFPLLLKWHARQRMMAHKYGRVESPIGRSRHLPDINSSDQGVVAEAERQAINSPVQSFASDMAVMALVLIDKELKRRGLKARSVGTVHDAINFECPEEELAEVVPLIKHYMENVPIEEWFGVHLDIPIIGDCKIGRRWGGADEIDNDVVTDPAKFEQWLIEHGYNGESEMANAI